MSQPVAKKSISILFTLMGCLALAILSPGCADYDQPIVNGRGPFIDPPSFNPLPGIDPLPQCTVNLFMESFFPQDPTQRSVDQTFIFFTRDTTLFIDDSNCPLIFSTDVINFLRIGIGRDPSANLFGMRLSGTKVRNGQAVTISPTAFEFSFVRMNFPNRVNPDCGVTLTTDDGLMRPSQEGNTYHLTATMDLIITHPIDLIECEGLYAGVGQAAPAFEIKDNPKRTDDLLSP